MFGVTGEGHLLIRVELAGGIEKTEHPGMHQIIQVDVNGKVLVHSHGNRFDERQMLEHDAIPPCGPGWADLHGLGLHFGSLSVAVSSCGHVRLTPRISATL